MLETIRKLDSKIRHAFILAKRDIYDLRAAVKMQQEVIKKLSDSQKTLLARIEKLEKARTVVKTIKVAQPKVIRTKVIRAKKTYVGAKTTQKVHSMDCPFGKNIKPKNKVIFRTKTKAFNEGFSACDCLR
ncbi:TPA: hypothetical protein HA239_02595 [Candidatus Woesearchaeota archaeon]|nr:hypothetical protein QT06_C0001G1121 [archaeon GW2011_AR15]MBS3104409.1 hypothetical protein [Candidatus Woesearchaeota archaeon]HIH41278.1 hypothetical protein [Candidatus Woesearchaeota archaeon]